MMEKADRLKSKPIIVCTPPWWDAYSGQPYTLPKSAKSRLGKENLVEYSKILTTLVRCLPALIWEQAKIARERKRDEEHKFGVPASTRCAEFVGLGVSLDVNRAEQYTEMVDELGVRHLLLRVPIWDIANLDHYVNFASAFSGRTLLINVLQDRVGVENHEVWRKSLHSIFSAFRPITQWYQIGNAVNRTKWGCAHTGKYLELAQIAHETKAHYPGIKLAGSSVIDYEPLITLRTLVNDFDYHFDVCASALYVNRRGSPHYRQYGIFDLATKIRTIASIVRIATRCDPRLWITETNWPLLNTKPYTPNSGHPRSTVDEATQSRYLVEFFRIAWESRLVERVYWWQLVNPGYGLVDDRNGTLRKLPAYYALKDVIRHGVHTVSDHYATAPN